MVPRTNPGLIGFTLPASSLPMPSKKSASSWKTVVRESACKRERERGKNHVNETVSHAMAKKQGQLTLPFVLGKDSGNKLETDLLAA